MPGTSTDATGFYKALKVTPKTLKIADLTRLLGRVNQSRVEAIAASISAYINANVPGNIEQRSGLGDYRTNPYVLIASATVVDLTDAQTFARFLFNNKLYMGFETSFGKSIESIVMGHYPVDSSPSNRWAEPPEKTAEHAALSGLSQEQRARRRVDSVWREVDKSVIVGGRRYLTSVKSGPNTINDTQVDAMTKAITAHSAEWLRSSRRTTPPARGIDFVLGLTYGTARTTNNKENQLLVKLLENGFTEENRARNPGVMLAPDGADVRVYRAIGQDFWAFVGNPASPNAANFVFIEVLLGLLRGLTRSKAALALENKVNQKIQELAVALQGLAFPPASLPPWVRSSYSDHEIFLLTTALSAFYDKGV
jgi:hypothetical protein